MGPTRVRKWFVFQNGGSISEKFTSDHFKFTSLHHPTPVKRPELQLPDLVIGPELWLPSPIIGPELLPPAPVTGPKLCVYNQLRIGTLCADHRFGFV